MRQLIDIIDVSENYSVMLAEHLRKWRDTGYVEDCRFDVFERHTAMTVRFSEHVDRIPGLDLGNRTLVFEFDKDCLAVRWTDRAGDGWIFVVSEIGAADEFLDEMVGYLNYPMGFLVQVVHDRKPGAQRFGTVAAAMARRAAHCSVEGKAVERLLAHGDVADLTIARVDGGMRFDIGLSDTCDLPVRKGPSGRRSVSFVVYPEETVLVWQTALGREEERVWPSDEAERGGVTTDMMATAMETVTGEKAADRRGKAANPVWAMLRRIEAAVA